jgi:DNA repair exonuclease SbcCD ATPase subunit
MGKKIKIRVKKPWVAYPGSVLQQNYAEELVHGFLLWNIKDKHDFDVKFCELPNPKPFVTIDWLGDVGTTISAVLRNNQSGCRFRVFSKESLSQNDIIDVTTRLRNEAQASEVTFKTEYHINRDIVTAGSTSVIKDDLRNIDVLMKLIKDYHKGSLVNDAEWDSVYELLKNYLVIIGSGDVVRNTKWSLRHLRFDNTFTYGESNVINFDNMSGIVGIFGPNRSGKSSIVGTIMYALFNGTDRGSVKNLHVVNARKPYCYSRAIINVNGSDYVIERQTTKNENRRGQVNASTALNLFKIEDGEAIDLAGEQRNDTEKIVKSLIGSSDDFLLTSLSAQDDIKLFITQGSSRRRQILSRFLDLDIFDKMYDGAKNDINLTKAVLKTLPDRDWNVLDEQHEKRLTECDVLINEKTQTISLLQEKLEGLRRVLADHKDITPVTKMQVDAQRSKVETLTKRVDILVNSIDILKQEIVNQEKKSFAIVDLQKEHDINELKKRLDAFRMLEASVQSLRHAHDTEMTFLKQQERSLKILDEVPCGDSFPSCKFIKDAHVNKTKVKTQRNLVESSLEKLRSAQKSLDVLKTENLVGRVEKIERLNVLHSRLQVEISNKKLELVKQESGFESLIAEFEPAKLKLEELEEALKNEENAEIVALRSEIDELQNSINTIDSSKMLVATERGRILTIMDKQVVEKKQRGEILQKMKAYELITRAFSRRGIPNSIITSQLPIINAEIAKILHGIVDYTVEFECDDENDSMEIYINYGDSRRIIELGSGMEKMIASVAIRVALTNVSTLPKTDVFIIDEGFGALDDISVEACNRLLMSLKRYFKTVMVITHVDGVKDAVDVIIEVTKNEKDALVTYN